MRLIRNELTCGDEWRWLSRGCKLAERQSAAKQPNKSLSHTVPNHLTAEYDNDTSQSL